MDPYSSTPYTSHSYAMEDAQSQPHPTTSATPTTPSSSSSHIQAPHSTLSPAPIEIGDKSYSYSSVHAPPNPIQLPKIVTAMTSISVMDDVPHPSSTQRLPSISSLTTHPFASKSPFFSLPPLPSLTLSPLPPSLPPPPSPPSPPLDRRLNSVGIGRSSSSSAALDRPFDPLSSSTSSTSPSPYHPYDRPERSSPLLYPRPMGPSLPPILGIQSPAPHPHLSSPPSSSSNPPSACPSPSPSLSHSHSASYTLPVPSSVHAYQRPSGTTSPFDHPYHSSQSGPIGPTSLSSSSSSSSSSYNRIPSLMSDSGSIPTTSGASFSHPSSSNSGPSSISNSLTLPPILPSLPPSFTSPSLSSSSSSSSSSVSSSIPSHPGPAVPLRQSISMGHFHPRLPPLTSSPSSSSSSSSSQFPNAIPSTRIPPYSRVVVLSEPGIDDPCPPRPSSRPSHSHHPPHAPHHPHPHHHHHHHHPYLRPYASSSTSSLPSSPYASATSSVSSLLDEEDPSSSSPSALPPPFHHHPLPPSSTSSSSPPSSSSSSSSSGHYNNLSPSSIPPFLSPRNRPIHHASSTPSLAPDPSLSSPASSYSPVSSSYSPASSSTSSPNPSVPASPSMSPSTSPTSSSSSSTSSPLNEKALSALERRRIRNQKSSAAFRARRKQYQADLEQGIMTLQSTLHRATDAQGRPLFQEAMSEMRSAVLTLPKMEQDSSLVGTGLSSLPPEIAILSPAERRRFQNKLSARVFRERRRQLIAALEQDFKSLLSLHRTAPEVFPLRALPASLYPMCGIKEGEGTPGPDSSSSTGEGKDSTSNLPSSPPSSSSSSSPPFPVHH
ncbi:MAG: hypothetical protein DHS80DRAFT_23439 [Piptocephalis tieghemiana]|nr:MAG: hypothetical protein DHS80DRAFT_23439 [Piptocephalis tieghemiana]